MSTVKNYLTKRQKEILEFIEDFTASNGISPTHREICEQFGYSSYGTVHKHLKLLQQKGFLRRDWNQKRGLELVRPAASAAEPPLTEVPFYGRIAAGRPIEALPGNDSLPIPPSLLRGAHGDHYVLQVSGDSMIEEGIHDGDLVVIQRTQHASPGEMVVALVDDEATLKRFYPEGEIVRLQPAHPTMQPMRFPAESVRIQGIVVGLMRSF